MDVKTFALGAICGIVASTCAYWLIDSTRDGGRTVSEQVASHRLQPQSSNPAQQVSRAAPVEDQVHQLPDVPTSSPDRPVSPDRSTGIPVTGSAEDPPVESAEDSGVAEGEPMSLPDTGPKARAERAKEPKDLSWSHNMEQTLRHYLASHPKAPQFDFTRVDCRTTFCDVEAIGFDPSTRPVWAQVIYDVGQQHWNDFGPWQGTTESSKDGRILFTTTFHRVRRR